MTINRNTYMDAARHPVKCDDSPTGKHVPRTVEAIDANNVHIKTSVCHHCGRVA